MIYIDKNTTQITLPKHNTGVNAEAFDVVIKSQINNVYTIAKDAMDISTNRLRYVFEIVPNSVIEAGEYEYNIFISETQEKIENGLLIYGEYTKPKIISTDVQRKNLVFNGKRKNGSDSI